jgi:hypothetical protein
VCFVLNHVWCYFALLAKQVSMLTVTPDLLSSSRCCPLPITCRASWLPARAAAARETAAINVQPRCTVWCGH